MPRGLVNWKERLVRLKKQDRLVFPASALIGKKGGQSVARATQSRYLNEALAKEGQKKSGFVLVRIPFFVKKPFIRLNYGYWLVPKDTADVIVKMEPRIKKGRLLLSPAANFVLNAAEQLGRKPLPSSPNIIRADHSSTGWSFLARIGIVKLERHAAGGIVELRVVDRKRLERCVQAIKEIVGMR